MARKKNQLKKARVQGKRKRHVNLTTLIIIAEGDHDWAFLKHMQTIYDGRTGQKVTIDSSNGGSPHDIIKSTNKRVSDVDYNRKFILMDSDVTIRQQDYDFAKKQGIVILLSEPICLEGMLLDVLKQVIPHTAEKCKQSLHPQLSGDPIEPTSYSLLFDKTTLEGTNKETIVRLRKLLKNKQ